MERPVFDWPELARRAESGKPESLASALWQLQAWCQTFDKRLTRGDLHPDVLTYLSSQARPTGKGGRKAYSQWELCLLHQHMEMWRPLIYILKKSGGTIEVTRKRWTIRIAGNGTKARVISDGAPQPLNSIGRGTPGDLAMHLYAVATNRSSLTVRDMLYRKQVKP